MKLDNLSEKEIKKLIKDKTNITYLLDDYGYYKGEEIIFKK